MTPAINFCDMDCIYCWRERNNSSFDNVDQPKDILDNSLIAQKKLLAGFKGNKKTDMQKFKESHDPIHIAISLSGEITYYPLLSELIKEIKDRNWSSFLVTNGQQPKVLEKIEPPTQLYISLDAPNKELMHNITNPMHKDAWERLMQSLDVLAGLKGKTRTALRLTVIKGINDIYPEDYAKIFTKANPDFIEIKSYMFVGASRHRLTLHNMPLHHEVKAFAKEIEKYCDYRIEDEHKPSRVVLMTKSDSAPRLIDFKSQ